jgi:outer membrane protein OmpA-like peptidoglycan-associated protein
MIVVRSLLGLLLCLSLISVSSAPLRAQSGAVLQFQPSSEAAPLSAPVGAPTPIRFEAALMKAANDLLSKANLGDGQSSVDIVIDPLIDGVTGAQTKATNLEQQRIIRLIRTSYPRFRVLPFSTDSLLKRPLILVGTFTAINNDGAPTGPRDAYRICLAFADLKSQTIVSKAVARALPDGVDPTPSAFFKDSPGYAKDPATESYVKTCQATRVGDNVDETYTDSVLAASLVNEGIEAYNAGRYKAALELYENALTMPGGEQMRVYNGIYLASYKLHRSRTAMDAFGRMIDLSLKTSDRLAIKFLFKPGSTQFYYDPEARAPYQAWIGKIAQRTATNRSCLEVVGHTSATGLPAMNDRLSSLRADFIRDRVEAQDDILQGRLLSDGRGSREMLVGTGRDDQSDALDRRVEFKVVRCAT